MDLAVLPFPIEYARHVLPYPDSSPVVRAPPSHCAGCSCLAPTAAVPETPRQKGWACTLPLCVLSAESGESDSCFSGDNGLDSIRVPLWPEQLFVPVDRVQPTCQLQLLFQATSKSPLSLSLASVSSMCCTSQLSVHRFVIAQCQWGEEWWSWIRNRPSHMHNLLPQGARVHKGPLS